MPHVLTPFAPHIAVAASLPRCFAALLLIVFSCAPASAQTLRGRAVDPDDRPVAGARVLVLHGEIVAAASTTDADGRFGPLDLSAGDYDVAVAAPGLSAGVRPVSLRAGSTLEVTLPLAISAVQESVLVSAAHVETPLTRTTESATVIDRAEIESAQLFSVADAMRRVPGMHVAASGGVGAITSFFPRGGESNYTLVLVDGVPQNAFGGGFDAAHLDTAGVDRIEVVRGPKSALYGNGAIGGIVHVVTRHGGPVRARAAFEGGGYGTLRSTASASGSRGPWRWAGAFDRLTSDGDTRERANLQRRVANDDYERLVGAGSVGWSDRPDRSVRIDVRAGRDVRGYPGAYGSDPLRLYGGLDLISRGRNTTRSVGASASIGDTFPGRHRVQFGWFDVQSAYDSPFGLSDDRTRRLTGRYQFDLELRRAGLSAGAEILHERANNTFITGERFQPVPIARLVSGWFVEARPALGRRVLLTAGARLERIARGALEASPGVRPAMSEDVVWSLNPKLSAAWFARGADAANWTKLRASAGTGIKPPTGFEIANADNPSLKPERNRSVDAGIEQAIARASVVAEATWFLNRYDDLIVAIGSSLAGASRYRTDNIANARSRGLETGLRWQSARGLAARAAWTWLDTRVLGSDGQPAAAKSPYAVGDPLVRRPRHQWFGELTWTGARARAFVTAGGRGRMTDFEPNYVSTLVSNPGYATLAFGGSLALPRGVELFGRVTNALDRTYEEVFGFPALGRTAMVGIRVAAGR